MFLLKDIRHKIRGNKGASSLEIGLLVGLVAVAAIAGVSVLGGKVEDTYGCIEERLSNSTFECQKSDGGDHGGEEQPPIDAPIVSLSVNAGHLQEGQSAILTLALSGGAPTSSSGRIETSGSCQAGSGSHSTSIASGANTISWTANLAGCSVNFCYSAENKSGSDSDCAGISFDPKLLAPTVQLSVAPGSVAEGQAAAISLVLGGGTPDSSNSTYEISAGSCLEAPGAHPTQLSSGTNMVVWSTTLAGCSIDYCHTASNAAGSDNACATLGFTTKLEAPDVSLSANRTSVPEGENATLTLALAGGAATTSNSTYQTTTGTCQVTPGIHTLTLANGANTIAWTNLVAGCAVEYCHSAENGAGADNACATITFASKLNAPTVSLAADKGIIAEGETAALTLSLGGGAPTSLSGTYQTVSGSCPAGLATHPTTLNVGVNNVPWALNLGGCQVAYCATAANAAGSNNACTTISYQARPDTQPDPMAFTTVTGSDPGASVTSIAQTLQGVDGNVTVTSSGGTFRINNGPILNSGTARNGDEITLQATASATWNGEQKVSLSVGSGNFSWSVFTRAQDRLPDVKINSVNGVTVTPGGGGTIGPATMTGFDGPLEFTVLNGLAEVNGAAGVTSGTLMPGAVVKLTYIAPMTMGTDFTVALDLGDGRPMQRKMTTDGVDTSPSADAFEFYDVPTNTLYTSPSVTPTGYNVSISVSINNGAQISIAGGAWGTTGTISPGQSYRVRMMSSIYTQDFTAASVTLGTSQNTVIYFTPGWVH